MAQINKPTDYFNTKIFTGNNSADNSITGVGFQPDLIWFKNRDALNNHCLVDSVRGRKALNSDLTNAEATLNADKDFQSFDSDGFTVDVVEQFNSFNKSGDSIVTWNWLADNTSGSSNTDGSITSTVSANTTSGFSIVSYTGTGANATVGHGLGVAPKFMIVKTIDASRDWTVYHGGISGMAGGYIILNATDAFSTAFSTIWNNTDPTSSVFSVGTANTSNNLNSNYIAYCFAEKQGYSKFGSYTGNGNADGTFVYTGFKPAFLIAKKSSTTSSWGIFDNKRTPYNVMDLRLLANTSGADDQSSDNNIDFLSNGFKFRSSAGWNASATYIYMAFAEQPLVGTNDIPATAR
jgi:hypothetical protein